MNTLAALLAVVLACGVTASGQEPAKVEITGAYSFTRQVGASRFGSPGRQGYEVSATGYPLRSFGLEVSISDYFGTEHIPPGVLFPAGGGPSPDYRIATRISSFMAGPKVAIRSGRLVPYAHGLLGGVRQRTTPDID